MAVDEFIAPLHGDLGDQPVTPTSEPNGRAYLPRNPRGLAAISQSRNLASLKLVCDLRDICCHCSSNDSTAENIWVLSWSTEFEEGKNSVLFSISSIFFRGVLDFRGLAGYWEEIFGPIGFGFSFLSKLCFRR